MFKSVLKSYSWQYPAVGNINIHGWVRWPLFLVFFWFCFLFFLAFFMYLDFIWAHKNVEKELCQCLAILTSLLVNNAIVSDVLLPSCYVFCQVQVNSDYWQKWGTCKLWQKAHKNFTLFEFSCRANLYKKFGETTCFNWWISYRGRLLTLQCSQSDWPLNKTLE